MSDARRSTLLDDRLVDVHLVDQVQTALEVEPQLDPLLEVLVDELERRIRRIRRHRGDQVEDSQYGDETVESRLPPPGAFHGLNRARGLGGFDVFGALGRLLGRLRGFAATLRRPVIELRSMRKRTPSCTCSVTSSSLRPVMRADDATLGDDVVALLELRQHALVLLRLLRLGTDHQDSRRPRRSAPADAICIRPLLPPPARLRHSNEIVSHDFSGPSSRRNS